MGFEKAIKDVLKHEGGYVHDPHDRGGETNFGISKRSHPDVDIKNLTEEHAVGIYHEHYWIPSKAEKLPEKLQNYYFDMCVNLGQRNGVKVLQKACNSKGPKMISVDGRIGPQTIKASNSLELERLKSFRVLYYANLVHSNPTQEKFWYGWFKRALK
tara:strand:+ start:457 stop:927 length:471 start_codon:yes stop_codon:yes gene_type:complete